MFHYNFCRWCCESILLACFTHKKRWKCIKYLILSYIQPGILLFFCPNAQCIIYLPAFAPKTTQMYVCKYTVHWAFEQCRKETWLFDVFWGIILPLYVGISINHYKDPQLTNQDSMKSRRVFFVAHVIQAVTFLSPNVSKVTFTTRGKEFGPHT